MDGTHRAGIPAAHRLARCGAVNSLERSGTCSLSMFTSTLWLGTICAGMDYNHLSLIFSRSDTLPWEYNKHTSRLKLAACPMEQRMPSQAALRIASIAVLFFLFVAGTVILGANSAGPPPGLTGGFYEQDCKLCHKFPSGWDWPQTSPERMTSPDLPVSYIPGKTPNFWAAGAGSDSSQPDFADSGQVSAGKRVLT